MSRYTKEPWIYSDGKDRRGNEYAFPSVCINKGGKTSIMLIPHSQYADRETMKADCKLASASPDMLAALQEALSLAIKASDIDGWENVCDIIESAIAKAATP